MKITSQAKKHKRMADSTPKECGSGMLGANSFRGGRTDDATDEDLGTISTSFDSGEHNDQLIQNIEMLRLSTGYTDLTITIDNQKFPCHKV
jgi:hypothetical protein